MSEKDMNLNHEMESEMTVTLTLDDDSELECDVLAIFPVEGQDYIALLPQTEGSEEVYLYRFAQDGEDMQLDNIEDDEEFERVAEAYDSMIDDMEYDEMMGEDEE